MKLLLSFFKKKVKGEKFKMYTAHIEEEKASKDSIFPTNEEFFVKTGLYKSVTIDNSETRNKAFDLLFCKNSMDCFCIDCDKDSVFTSVTEFPRQPDSHLGGYTERRTADHWYSDIAPIANYIKEFLCSRDSKHTLYFFMQVKEDKLSKVGQTPSYADLSSHHIKKYRKLLDKSTFKELNVAVGLYAHDVGVGSFVYLRRILENYIVKAAYEKAKQTTSWDDEAYRDDRFSGKIERLKSFLPQYLVTNTLIYGIISKGIHELSEEECSKYFPVILAAIERVLTEDLNKKEDERKQAEMTKELNKIGTNLK